MFNKGKYEMAFEFLQKSLNIKERILGYGHLSVAIALYNIGFFWEEKGDAYKALEFYQNSLDHQ